MKHLDDGDLVDLLDGKTDAGTAAHLQACAQCRAELVSMQAAMETLRWIAADEESQPSPLFWDHFARQVTQRIDALPTGWTAWLRAPRLAAAMTTVTLILVVAVGIHTLRDAKEGSPTAVVEVTPPTSPGDQPRDDVEADAAWAVVRSAAQDLAYEDAAAAGIAPQAGAAERAVSEMSNEERAELARLLDYEMKRTGA